MSAIFRGFLLGITKGLGVMEKPCKQGVCLKDIIRTALDSCESFAQCSKSFFNFKNRNGWLGWENWLAVDIFRRLNSTSVIPFAPYSECKKKLTGKMDLFVRYPNKMAIEIKTNYLDVKDLNGTKKESIGFPDRIIHAYPVNTGFDSLCCVPKTYGLGLTMPWFPN